MLKRKSNPVVHGPTKRRKIDKRAKSAYDFYKSHFLGSEMLEEQNSLRMKELSSRWKEMGPLEKETFEKMKEEHVPLQPTDLDKDELRTYANSIRRDIQKLCDKLQEIHFDVLVVDIDKSTGSTVVYGSEKGTEFLNLRPDIEWQLAGFCSGTGAADAKDPNKELRRNVAKLLNTKFYVASKYQRTRVSYKLIQEGYVTVTGLPEGMETLKKVANCSRSELEKLSAGMDNIEFSVDLSAFKKSTSAGPKVFPAEIETASSSAVQEPTQQLTTMQPEAALNQNSNEAPPSPGFSCTGTDPPSPSTVKSYHPTHEDIEVAKRESKRHIFYVEKILNHRETNGRREFLVKWLGFSYKDTTWEGESNLQQDIIRRKL